MLLSKNINLHCYFILRIFFDTLMYRIDVYTYLTSISEKIIPSLVGHQEVIRSVYYLLSSPEKLIRAITTDFLRVYVFVN